MNEYPYKLNNKIYFAAKGLSRVYRFKDADTTFTEFETFVGGKNSLGIL